MNVSTSQEEINNCDKTHYTNWIYKHVTDGKTIFLPGPQRVQPILVNDGKKLYLIGGFQAPSDSSASILSHDILCYTPQTDKWEYDSHIPYQETRKNAVWQEVAVYRQTHNLS